MNKLAGEENRKIEGKSNVLAGWLLVAALIVLPFLLKYLFFPD